VCVCVCVCVYTLNPLPPPPHTLTPTPIYIHIIPEEETSVRLPAVPLFSAHKTLITPMAPSTFTARSKESYHTSKRDLLERDLLERDLLERHLPYK